MQSNLYFTYFNRFQLNTLQKISAFKEPQSESLVKINTIYIDSTFFCKSYLQFPTQFESSNLICDLIAEWLAKGLKYKISLRTAARYGYEFLFQQISERFKIKVHVNAEELEKYHYFPELDNCFTSESNASRIHACFSVMHKNSPLLCCDPDYDPKYICVIKPTAMFWQQWQTSEKFYSKIHDRLYRVCYSNHASYREIQQLVNYLKPDKCEFNVLPSDNDRKIKFMENMNEIIAQYSNDIVSTVNGATEDEEKEEDVVSFNKIKFKKPKIKTAEQEDEQCGSLSTIILPKRRRQN